MATKKKTVTKKATTTKKRERRSIENPAEFSKNFNEEFCLVWQMSARAEDVNKHFGLPADDTYAAAKASQFRKKGVNLKNMKRNNVDVDGLNAFLENYNSEEEVEEEVEEEEEDLT